jgi:hypothetical protein
LMNCFGFKQKLTANIVASSSMNPALPVAAHSKKPAAVIINN